MEDKTVGEIWRRYQGHVRNKPIHADSTPLLLIRKLVDERAMRWQSEQGIAGGTAGFYKALRDFGIDPETWGTCP